VRKGDRAGVKSGIGGRTGQGRDRDRGVDRGFPFYFRLFKYESEYIQV
jgi:hypothetical protein